jgi:hypothetical protein
MGISDNSKFVVPLDNNYFPREWMSDCPITDSKITHWHIPIIKLYMHNVMWRTIVANLTLTLCTQSGHDVIKYMIRSGIQNDRREKRRLS